MRQGQHKSIFPDDSERPVGTDNVFLTGVYKWPLFDLKIAIQNFKETHHPTMFDNPKAVIKAYFELDLSTKKKVRDIVVSQCFIWFISHLLYYYFNGKILCLLAEF